MARSGGGSTFRSIVSLAAHLREAGQVEAGVGLQAAILGPPSPGRRARAAAGDAEFRGRRAQTSRPSKFSIFLMIQRRRHQLQVPPVVGDSDGRRRPPSGASSRSPPSPRRRIRNRCSGTGMPRSGSTAVAMAFVPSRHLPPPNSVPNSSAAPSVTTLAPGLGPLPGRRGRRRRGRRRPGGGRTCGGRCSRTPRRRRGCRGAARRGGRPGSRRRRVSGRVTPTRWPGRSGRPGSRPRRRRSPSPRAGRPRAARRPASAASGVARARRPGRRRPPSVSVASRDRSPT